MFPAAGKRPGCFLQLSLWKLKRHPVRWSCDCHVLKSHIIHVERQKTLTGVAQSCSFPSKGHLPAASWFFWSRSSLLGGSPDFWDSSAWSTTKEKSGLKKRAGSCCWLRLISSVKRVVSDKMKQRQIVSVKNKEQISWGCVSTHTHTHNGRISRLWQCNYLSVSGVCSQHGPHCRNHFPSATMDRSTEEIKTN